MPVAPTVRRSRPPREEPLEPTEPPPATAAPTPGADPRAGHAAADRRHRRRRRSVGAHGRANRRPDLRDPDAPTRAIRCSPCRSAPAIRAASSTRSSAATPCPGSSAAIASTSTSSRRSTPGSSTNPSLIVVGAGAVPGPRPVGPARPMPDGEPARCTSSSPGDSICRDRGALPAHPRGDPRPPTRTCPRPIQSRPGHQAARGPPSARGLGPGRRAGRKAAPAARIPLQIGG